MDLKIYKKGLFRTENVPNSQKLVANFSIQQTGSQFLEGISFGEDNGQESSQSFQFIINYEKPTSRFRYYFNCVIL